MQKLFIDYLRKSPSSPYENVISIFSDKEYQKYIDNLIHIHLTLKINLKLLTEAKLAFVKYLIQYYILEIVRPYEV